MYHHGDKPCKVSKVGGGLFVVKLVTLDNRDCGVSEILDLGKDPLFLSVGGNGCKMYPVAAVQCYGQSMNSSVQHTYRQILTILSSRRKPS